MLTPKVHNVHTNLLKKVASLLVITPKIHQHRTLVAEQRTKLCGLEFVQHQGYMVGVSKIENTNYAAVDGLF